MVEASSSEDQTNQVKKIVPLVGLMKMESGFFRGDGITGSNDEGKDHIHESFFSPLRRKSLQEREMQNAKKEITLKQAMDDEIIKKQGEMIKNAPLKNPLPANKWHLNSKSPNSLRVLFGPHVNYACNLIKNRKKKYIKKLHERDWDSSSSERADKMEIKIKRFCATKEKLAVQPSKTQSTPDIEIVKPREPIANPPEITMEDDSVEDVPGIHLEIVKYIVLREELLAHLSTVVGNGLVERFPNSWFNTPKFFIALSEIQRIGIQVIELIVRRHRTQSFKKLNTPTNTWNHSRTPLNYMWRGLNYVLKMRYDLAFANSYFHLYSKSSLLPGVTTLVRNPFVLQMNLDQLLDALGSTDYSIHCPESEIWKVLNRPSIELIRKYRCALVILNEEQHFTPVAPLSPITPPMTLTQEKNSIIKSTYNEKTPSHGCWNQNGKIQVHTPFVLKIASVLYRKRLEFLKSMKLQVAVHDHASRILSKVFRHYLILNQRVRLSKKRHLCTKLQAIARGRLSRRQTTSLKERLERRKQSEGVKAWLTTSENKSIIIQCCWRCFTSTRWVQRMRETRANTRIAAWFRSLLVQRWHSEYINARKIQCWFRVHAARNELIRRREDYHRGVAATCIQSRCRIYLAKSVVLRTIQVNASIEVQRIVRGKLARVWTHKYISARIIECRWRMYHASRVLIRYRLQRLGAMTIQRWYRCELISNAKLLCRRMREWQRSHTSAVQRANIEYEPQSCYHLCSLYDMLPRLRYKKHVLERTKTAKQALANLKHQLKHKRQQWGYRNVPHILMSGMFSVKDRYGRLLVATQHFSDDELDDRIQHINREIQNVMSKINAIERLVSNRVKAELLEEKVRRFINIPDVVPSTNDHRLAYGLYQGDLRRIKQMEWRLYKLHHSASRYRQQQDLALGLTEWSFPIKLEQLVQDDSEILITVRKREAELCGRQLSRFVRNGAIARTAMRKIEAIKEKEWARRMKNRWAGMEAEDAYATEFRKYLAADAKLINKATNLFQKYDQDHSGDIGVLEFQKLAFDLNITVTKAKIQEIMKHIDLNGNSSVDMFEFTMWWLCRSHDDKMQFKAEIKQVRNNLKMGGVITTMMMEKAIKTVKKGFEDSKLKASKIAVSKRNK